MTSSPNSPNAVRRRRHHRDQVVVVAGAVLAAVLLLAAVVVTGVGARTEFEPVAATPLTDPTPAPTPTLPATPIPTPTLPATPAPTPTPTATPTPSSTPSPDPVRPTLPPVQAPVTRGMLHVPPVHIEMLSVGISSDLVRLGLNPGGSLQVPEDYGLAGWYADGPYPGDTNSPPAVIVGHVDSTTGPAVFYRLRELETGDEIRVTRTDGSVAVFRVRDATQYPKASLPADEVYASREPSELVLITCSGAFDETANSYLDNYVVTAQLDREASGLES